MKWSEFFGSIQDLGETVLINPFDELRAYELTDWWGANAVNWMFMLICSAAIVYWLMQIQKHNTNNEDDRNPKAHGFLGNESDLEHRL
ncbi:MAG: hypothetical protein ACI828_002057 [Flavobacteriales bacterium]|jgi:hypothetical protein